MKFLAVLMAILPGAAMAHTGHATPVFATGLLHPLSGIDHVLAMLAVGLWAAGMGGRARWALPVAFVVAMVAGSRLVLPAVEPMILASLVILGAAVALALRPPLAMSVGHVSAFGAFHGAAHGLEAPAGGFGGYAAGFLLATLALHGAGLVLGSRVTRHVRLLGTGTALAGLALSVV